MRRLALSDEKRASPRVPLESLVHNDRFTFASAVNISLGGLCLVIGTPCEIGDRIKVEFFLDDQERKIVATAETVWTQWSPPGSYMSGQRFCETKDDDLELIRLYCLRRSATQMGM